MIRMCRGCGVNPRKRYNAQYCQDCSWKIARRLENKRRQARRDLIPCFCGCGRKKARARKFHSDECALKVKRARDLEIQRLRRAGEEKRPRRPKPLPKDDGDRLVLNTAHDEAREKNIKVSSVLIAWKFADRAIIDWYISRGA